MDSYCDAYRGGAFHSLPIRMAMTPTDPHALSGTAPAPPALNIALWAVQGLLLVAFGAAGLMKLTTPADALAASPQGLPVGLVRFIGGAEFAGALGVVLPALTRIRPALTPLAAAGLVAVMVLAAAFHLSRGEVVEAGPAVVLGALAAFVVWGRGRRAPVAPRA